MAGAPPHLRIVRRPSAGASSPGSPGGGFDLAFDLAFDEALLARAEPVASLWTPGRSAAVVGVASRTGEELHLDRVRADGLPVFRRATGGAAVLLTPGVACFSLVLPHADYPGSEKIGGAYRRVFSFVERALGSMGVKTDFEPPGDLACAGRKLVGLAQAKRRTATLVHGVIPVDLDLDEVERYIARPREEPAYRGGRSHGEFMTTLARQLGRCGPADVLRALRAAFAGDAPDEPPGPGLVDEAHRLAEEKYRAQEWTFRR